jgi:hypothetical protein
MAKTDPTATEASIATTGKERGELIDGWTPSGRLGSPTLRDHPEEPSLTSAIHFWQRCDGEKVGIARSPDYADEGYPWVVLKSVRTGESGPVWKYTDIAKTEAAAIEAAARRADFREYLHQSRASEQYYQWVDRTGGTVASIEMQIGE